MASVINANTSGGLISTGDTSGVLQLQTGGTAAVTIDASQNVGVGTASPAVKFQVSNGNAIVDNATLAYLRVAETSTGNSNRAVLLADSTGMNLVADYSSTAIPMLFKTSNTERMRLDTSGNLGLGVTPSALWSSNYRILSLSQGSPNNFISSIGQSNVGTLFFSVNYYAPAGSTNYTNDGYALQYAMRKDVGEHRWYTSASGTATSSFTFTQSMTLDASGDLLVGQTSRQTQNSRSFDLDKTDGCAYINHASGDSSGNYYVAFGYNAVNIGSITQNGTTGVLYNLTSDYRLKNNPKALTGAKDFVMALQPKTWDWWDGSGKGVGFIAHEFMEVAQYSGHGEKDAVDEDGNPVYQSIQPSSSEVMANLVALIQEQQSTITQLTERISALEGAK